MSRQGQFYGVGRKKAGRRRNRPNGSPRKVYAYTRRDQKGTPVEAFINSYYSDLDEQRNALKPYPGRMSQSESYGNLAAIWDGVNKRGTSGRAIRKHIEKNGGTAAGALKVLIGMYEVSFGADPKQA